MPTAATRVVGFYAGDEILLPLHMTWLTRLKLATLSTNLVWQGFAQKKPPAPQQLRDRLCTGGGLKLPGKIVPEIRKKETEIA